MTDRWLKLNFASCVIRQTRSLGVLVLCSNWNNMVFVNYIYDMVVHTQFHKFYGRPFASVLYLFLMKDIGRWLPWVLPGSTGRFYKDDIVHNNSAHGYYIPGNPHGGRGKIRMILLLHVKQNKTKLIKNCHPNNTIVGSGYISYERLFEWWDEQNRCTCMM